MSIEIHKSNILNCQLFIGKHVFEEMKFFFDLNKYKSNELYVLVDENSRKYCLPDVINKINSLNRATIIEIKSGEANKTIDTAIFVWKKMLEFGADRNAILVNIGGGVICDMGGFVASLFKRGIKFINIPTTLMAQVDAGFGGKTAVDLEGMKNQIGLFNNPEGVFIFPSFINTLNKRQRLSGFAEIIKYALISDFISLEDLISFDIENENELFHLICESIETKGQIVNVDYNENGLRKILNFGHTIGHALETFSLLNDKEPLLHGEALVIGIVCEMFLSVKKFNLPLPIQNKMNAFILSKYGKYCLSTAAYDSLTGLMMNDKKNMDGQISFVLLETIGKPIINQTCTKIEIMEALDYYAAL